MEQQASLPDFRARILDLSLQEAMLPWLLIGTDGAVLDCGPALAELVDSPTDVLRGVPLEELLCDEDAVAVRDLLTDGDAAASSRMVNVRDQQGGRFSLRAQIAPCAEGLLIVGTLQVAAERVLQDQLHELTAELTTLARANQRQAKELRKALEERDRSYWHLQKLQEVLPVCMDCGTVKPDSDWMPLADYLKQNAILFSHGLCADCSDKRLRDLE